MEFCCSFNSKVFGLILVTTVLGGCAALDSPINPEAASRIKRAAVVSMTAREFAKQYVGITVFGNTRESIDSSSWEIDKKYEKDVASILNNEFGITVINATYSDSDFAHVNDLTGPWDAPAYWGPNWDAIETAAKNYCSANSLDALLVLAKGNTEDFIGRTNQYLRGAGIYSRGNISTMHLVSKMALIDCTTGKPIALRSLRRDQEDWRSIPRLDFPKEISSIPIKQWSSQNLQEVQRSLASLPSSAWLPSIASMFPSNK